MCDTADDKLLFLGTDGILNLSANCPFVSPSTISTPAFNEQWVEYFTEYPEKEPTVIVLAKNTIDNREKFLHRIRLENGLRKNMIDCIWKKQNLCV